MGGGRTNPKKKGHRQYLAIFVQKSKMGLPCPQVIESSLKVRLGGWSDGIGGATDLVILNRDQPQTMTRIDDLIAALSLDDLLLYT